MCHCGMMLEEGVLVLKGGQLNLLPRSNELSQTSLDPHAVTVLSPGHRRYWLLAVCWG